MIDPAPTMSTDAFGPIAAPQLDLFDRAASGTVESAGVKDVAASVVGPPDDGAQLASVAPSDAESPEPFFEEYTLMVTFILWLIAVVLVIAGIIQLLSGSIILGIVLIVIGLVVGPGGYSIFRNR